MLNSNEPLVPTVDALDLQRVYTMMSTVHTISQAQGHQSGGSLSLGIYAQLCSVGADVKAVWYRASTLLMLYKFAGPSLAKHEGVNGKIFQVAAKFPMKRMEPGVPQRGLPFDVNEFMKQLADESTR